MAELCMTALTDAILVTGIALTALLFAFDVRRLPGLQPLLPRTLIAGVIAYLLVSPINNALASPPRRRDRASGRFSGLSSSA
jgi:hypothetical protein